MLSPASFLPQIKHIKAIRDCAGISILYILFNLLVTTYQSVLFLHVVARHWQGRILVHQPPDLRDLVNLAQFVVGCIGQPVLQGLQLLPPHRPVWTRLAMIAFFSFLAAILIPALEEIFVAKDDRAINGALLTAVWLFILGPVMQLLGVAAFCVQARLTMSRGETGALSISGLLIQAVMFFVMGISFLSRLKMPSQTWQRPYMAAIRD
ncbi:hypothetical protein AC579_9539 [Pseudocercospora musae]|uniref:Uncharacterized protein n=1 Tax=Pseudocercospora musae TaxID=113226 RepID=A0A139GZ63_9PEZI|nr:hypothetical protein AC579_9539 [Pseudocercospora musae]